MLSENDPIMETGSPEEVRCEVSPMNCARNISSPVIRASEFRTLTEVGAR